MTTTNIATKLCAILTRFNIKADRHVDFIMMRGGIIIGVTAKIANEIIAQ